MRARHATQAANLEDDDVALAIGTRTKEMERARLSMANAQRRTGLLNLLKNAHESGSAPEDVELQVRRVQDLLRIEVGGSGSGSGKIDAVLTNALVPFYSTKRSGTGLGLARDRRSPRRAHPAVEPRGRRPGGDNDPACAHPTLSV
jgi:C4-dicarboxylate-specific signal transduction histidine kinase